MDWTGRKVAFEGLPRHLQESLIEADDKKGREYIDIPDEERADITKDLLDLTPEQVLRKWLENEGIIGYTTSIIMVVEAIQGASH